ncbi:M20 family metallopeptidase [Romboutsia sp. Marseille-P6047]|uniref:M20 family metallopeptidase n=1 Tax=Romboutsia sp. Marseille-P6047 TaxID=2161817 RepID=UPI000F05F7FF|nr:M20 family metallopeptidase [Romboutsia sp. Marseille-P6047]
MELRELKNLSYKIEDELRKEIEEVSDFIFNNPELGGQEYISSKYLVDKISQYGFNVEYPYCNIDTAFRAEIGDNEETSIAFLAEYDALPGYDGPNGLGHACGHNWIAAGTLGACLVLSKLKKYFKGKIVLIGTPAEETIGYKCNLVKAGVFNDIDIVFQMHIEAFNNINCKALAMDSIEFSFKGVAAHAASHPHMGVNALDAVQLTFAGINALRQHVTSDVRIHGIVSNGGEAPNIVPDRASCKFYVRAEDRKNLEVVKEKVINCAKGAELMTGSQLTYRYFENSFDNIINNSILQDIMRKNLANVGISELLESQDGPTGSTDIGNVSQVCPTMYTELALDICPIVRVHEKEFLNYANSLEAYDKLHKSVKAMVTSALEIYLDKKLLKEIKKEHIKNISL